MRPILAGIAAALLIGAATSPARADCVCRARDVVATHGQTICIQTPDGARLARCEKVSNVSSWRFLKDSCPVADISQPDIVADARPAEAGRHLH
jgi:hypothetical protein